MYTISMYGSKKERVVALLKQGLSYNHIAREVECSKGTVAYHAAKLNLSERPVSKLGPPKRYNWEEIQEFYDEGNTFRECRQHFGFTASAWDKAVKRGDVSPRARQIPLQEILIEGSSYNRGNLKKRLIDANLLSLSCSGCGGAPSWQGKPLTLVLDHINGVHNDHRIENLRLLCPNCNSQTATFAGRNRKYKS